MVHVEVLLDIYRQHLDRDQVDTPELCSNMLWAQYRSWRFWKIWLGGRAFEPRLCCEYATTCGKEACDELRSLCGHSADVCNGRRSVGECWTYIGST
jgi:hypothetical protein